MRPPPPIAGLFAIVLALTACGTVVLDPSAGAGAPSGSGGAPATAGAPASSASSASSASTSGAGGGSLGPCAVYAGKVDDMISGWTKNGESGLAAGDLACQLTVPGADHACEYQEVVVAAGVGELAGIPAGTTAWLERRTTAVVDGVTYAPGPGADCNGWTYPGGIWGNGEYISFDAPGLPTYHLDSDPTWDPTALDPNTQVSPHVQPGLPCGPSTVTRSILCCFPACAAP